MLASLALKSIVNPQRIKWNHTRLFCNVTKVPVELIKTLRTRTQAGITDCRNALIEAGLDVDKAEAILDAKAGTAALKKKDRHVSEGVLATLTDTTNRRAVTVELLCETDFASRSPGFGKLALSLAQRVLEEDIKTSDELLSLDGVKQSIDSAIFTMRENISVRRVSNWKSNLLGVYMHGRVDLHMGLRPDPASHGKLLIGSKQCVTQFALEGANIDIVSQETQKIVDKLAMHIYAYQPLAFDRKSAPPGTAPTDCLLEQDFCQEGKLVRSVLSELSDLAIKHNSSLVLKTYESMIAGEGIEKKQAQLGDEVQKLLNL